MMEDCLRAENPFRRLTACRVWVAFCGLIFIVTACDGSQLRGSGDEEVVAPANDVIVLADGVDASEDLGSPSDVVPPPDQVPDTTVVDPPMWEEFSLGDAGEISAVFAKSMTAFFAVGESRVLRWNGAMWAWFGSPSDVALNDVWSGDDVVVVVGSGGSVFRRSVGSMTWVQEETGTTSDLNGLSGRSSNDLWAVGDNGTVLHYDGVSWSISGEGGGFHLQSVWLKPQTSGTEGVYAVSTGGRLYTYDGGGWLAQQIASATSVLNDVWGVGEMLIAVGDDGIVTTKNSAGQSWKGQVTNDISSRDLMAIVGTSPTEITLVGKEGVIIDSDGDKWNVVDIFGSIHSTSDFVTAASVSEGQSSMTMLLGAQGGGLVRHEEGWDPISTRPQSGVRAIAGAGPETLWAVGSDGLLMANTPFGWSVDMQLGYSGLWVRAWKAQNTPHM